MKKLFLLLIPIILITLCGCNDNTLSQRVYDLENTQDMILQRVEVIEIDQIDKNIVDTLIIEETQPSDRPDFCMPMYERCIDNYFNDNCLNLYRDWNDIMCEIETWYSIPIREFKCNVCEWNYWMPINI